MKRKTFWAIVSCFVAFAISIGATYAWLVNEDPMAVTTLILGENRIDLVEIFEPPAELAPGIRFRKEPVVYNTGNWPTFVRARIEFSNLEGYAISELMTGDVVGTHPNWRRCGQAVNNPCPAGCDCGYFYYVNILHPTSAFEEPWKNVSVEPPIWVGYPWVGEPSSPLFTHVRIRTHHPDSGEVLDMVHMVDFDIILYVESRNHIDNHPACNVGFVADAPCTCPNDMWREIWNS